MAEPLLDLERLVAGIRWRRRIWLSLAMFGLVAGALLAILAPPVPTAVTRVLIVRADDDRANRTVLMATDVALCRTSEVAAAALERINVNEPPAALLDAYRCEAVTPNVLEITVSGTSADDAVRRAQALADVVIANHLERTQDAADAQATALLDRRARLEDSLATTNSTISSTTASDQLDALFAARAGLTSQILELTQRAEEAQAGSPAVTAGTSVVDPPRALPIGRTQAGVTTIMIGLVLGGGLGLALAAVLCVTRDRPIRRRDIAAHLGVSIIAQLPSPPWGPRRWRRRSRHVRDRQRAAATLAHAVRNTHTSVSLLEIGCPGTAARLALDIAGQLTAERPVVIVSDLSRTQLREAGATSGSSATIVDLAELPFGQDSPDRRSELHLGVGSVGPGKSWVDLGRLGAETLLIVRAGHATTLGLHTVARQLAHAEIAAIGVVLVAPDPRDRSDGALWDALHTARRGRHAVAEGPPPPVQRPAPAGNGRAVVTPSLSPDER